MLGKLIHAVSFWRVVIVLSNFVQVQAYKETMLFDYMPNCAGKEDMLDFHIAEARQLIAAAKHAIDTIDHNVVAQKLVTSYLKIEFVPVNGRAVARHEDWAEWARVKSKFILPVADYWLTEQCTSIWSTRSCRPAHIPISAESPVSTATTTLCRPSHGMLPRWTLTGTT